jgi:indolepyruvate ferredoxin oxidoreductase alpha subunit
MERKLLMGNEAIALGALRAGVRVVTGYPGTPSTEVLEAVAKHKPDGVYVEWSVNEKAALEVSAGAACSGLRAMVTMKQVGLNVASDPLMSLNYIGVAGGLVIVVADDPGPISSQTEQDTRRFAQFAKLALFDPSSPEEAFTMIVDAFAHSEKYGRPVLFRPTTRICHACASVAIPADAEGLAPSVNKADARLPLSSAAKDSRWVIFPRLANAEHKKIEDELRKISVEFSQYHGNELRFGTSRKGIAAGGISWQYAMEARSKACHWLKVSTVPFPDDQALAFLQEIDEVLVLEELDAVIEDGLIRLCGLHRLDVKVYGKRTGHMKNAGENSPDEVAKAIAAFVGETASETQQNDAKYEAMASHSNEAAALLTPPRLPVRPPVLCAGCPHRASFVNVKDAAKGKPAVFSGDIGCYTLGNAQPLNLVDTCLCMGAGITMAQGLQRAEPDAAHFAFIGDSTFFHSGITGVINAVYNRTDVIVVILDNSTTAMTGNQPHPGTGVTMMGEKHEKIDIGNVINAISVTAFYRLNPFDRDASINAVKEAMSLKGVKVILFESPCIALIKDSNGMKCEADTQKCTGCALCVRKLGCPAISMERRNAEKGGTKPVAVINTSLCTGCGLCVNVCPANAINSGQNEIIANASGNAPIASSVPYSPKTINSSQSNANSTITAAATSSNTASDTAFSNTTALDTTASITATSNTAASDTTLHPNQHPNNKPHTQFNCMIAGVGGQGTVLASKLIANAAMKRGYDVRTAETIGMAQRGGSVVSHVRAGNEVYSPLIPLGGADMLIAFEPAEAVRQLPYLKRGGLAIVCADAIKPASGALEGNSYEAGDMLKYLREYIAASSSQLIIVNAADLTMGNPRTLNVALLGVASQSGRLPFTYDDFAEALKEMLKPRFHEMNLNAFYRGLNY